MSSKLINSDVQWIAAGLTHLDNVSCDDSLRLGVMQWFSMCAKCPHFIFLHVGLEGVTFRIICGERYLLLPTPKRKKVTGKWSVYSLSLSHKKFLSRVPNRMYPQTQSLRPINLYLRSVTGVIRSGYVVSVSFPITSDSEPLKVHCFKINVLREYI